MRVYLPVGVYDGSPPIVLTVSVNRESARSTRDESEGVLLVQFQVPNFPEMRQSHFNKIPVTRTGLSCSEIPVPDIPFPRP